MTTIVLGGGFMGQLLQTLYPDMEVFDWRPTRPAPEDETRAFGPQYLWEAPPGLSVQCRSFTVFTTIDGRRADEDPDRVARYKAKVHKTLDASDWRTQFRYEMTGYEPLLSNERVQYGMRVSRIHRGMRCLEIGAQRFHYDRLISTIPLYALLGLLGMMDPGLLYKRIYVKTVQASRVNDNMIVNYVSDDDSVIYRETWRGDHITYESLTPLPGWRALAPGKIYRHGITEDLLAELEHSGIYCCGRFATWNPEELAHESLARLRSRMA